MDLLFRNLEISDLNLLHGYSLHFLAVRGLCCVVEASPVGVQCKHSLRASLVHGLTEHACSEVVACGILVP